ncbi:MAG TPA: DUF885 domain-containing protein [Steroidobacteraceae bacterium]|nr:DUF885 domain-containing protein [Steroidobacteraceae bacterium]
MRSTLVLAASAILASSLAGCASGPAPTQAPEPTPTTVAGETTTESQKLQELFEDYFERLLELNPILATSIGDPRYNDRFVVGIAPEVIEQEQKLERDYLARIQTIDRSRLTPQEQLSYDIFKSDRELEIEGFRFPGELLPLNQFYSTPNLFVQLGSGNGMQPFKTVKDYDDFLKRLDGLVQWTDQAIVNMRLGMQRGYTLPKVLVEKTLPQLQAHVVAQPEDSLYWGPITNLPADFPAADRERLTAAYRAAIETKVVPTYRKLHDFMRDEYLPKARTTHGMDALPDGKAWYAYNVKRVTTTDYTPEQIHQIGLDEVARIHKAMDGVMQQVGFKGTRNEFFKHLNTDPRFFWTRREDLVAGYERIKDEVKPQLPKLFEILPKADYEVRAVEPFREKSASGGQYQAASEDGSRPGIFYANAYDLRARPKWAMDALSLHEGSPGHHFQLTIQREQKDLPKFRRFGGYTAYVEGWGLYAESEPVGRALGRYVDPYQYFGQLEAELWRAIRLVVDTGLHSKGWTREQVLDYMDANSSAAEARRVSETERYMAIPGQALAYKIGQIKISELRARAEKSLGAKFDVRKFHTAVLADGALPLDVLEAKLDRWIESQR